MPVVEIPTAVGFCMYIRRRCVDETGRFDEANFGRGYGEENDFCRRAARKGWRHVAATNVYVHHYAAQSFGPDKEERVARAIETVERLHPGYLRMIHAFIARDPLLPCRRRLDEARIRQALPGAVLAVAASKQASGPTQLRLVQDAGRGAGTFRIESDIVPIVPNLNSIDPSLPFAETADTFQALGISRIDLRRAEKQGRLRRAMSRAGQSASIEVVG
jgi:hypothetical protein